MVTNVIAMGIIDAVNHWWWMILLSRHGDENDDCTEFCFVFAGYCIKQGLG
jgi:hypothetical protein